MESDSHYVGAQLCSELAKHTSNKGQHIAKLFTGSNCVTVKTGLKNNSMTAITNQKTMTFHKQELDQRYC